MTSVTEFIFFPVYSRTCILVIITFYSHYKVISVVSSEEVSTKVSLSVCS